MDKLNVNVIKLEDTPHHFNLEVSDKNTNEVIGSFDFQWEKTSNNDWNKEAKFNHKRVLDNLKVFCAEHNIEWNDRILNLRDEFLMYFELEKRRYEDIQNSLKLIVSPTKVLGRKNIRFKYMVGDENSRNIFGEFEFVWEKLPNNDIEEEAKLNGRRFRKAYKDFCEGQNIYWRDRYLSDEQESDMVYYMWKVLYKDGKFYLIF